MSTATSPLPARLLADRLVATLPDRPIQSLVAALEVMVQEGVTAVSFPVGQLEQLQRVHGMYAGRAAFAVHDVATDEELRRAAEAGADLVSLRLPEAALVEQARSLGVAVVATALTPTEVQSVARLGVDAVVVAPAEVMGSSYPEGLVQLAPDVTLMARGGLGAYSARRWCEAGAVAVWLDDALLGDVVQGGSLGGLRERCQSFRAAVED